MYIFDIYKRFNIKNNKVVNVPLEIGLKLIKDHNPLWKEEIDVMNTIPHEEVVTSLLFAMTCTWPYIAFVVISIYD
jgi:hypothetical protein